jgi:hypothetical protein
MTERVKLCQDFERWHTAKGPVEPPAPSFAEIFPTALGRDPGSQKEKTIFTLTQQAEYGLSAPDTSRFAQSFVEALSFAQS